MTSSESLQKSFSFLRQNIRKMATSTHREIFLKFYRINPKSNFIYHSDWFGTKRKSVWFQINRNMVITIRFRFDLIRFRKKFSVCSELQNSANVASSEGDARCYKINANKIWASVSNSEQESQKIMRNNFFCRFYFFKLFVEAEFLPTRNFFLC